VRAAMIHTAQIIWTFSGIPQKQLLTSVPPAINMGRKVRNKGSRIRGFKDSSEMLNQGFKESRGQGFQ